MEHKNPPGVFYLTRPPPPEPGLIQSYNPSQMMLPGPEFAQFVNSPFLPGNTRPDSIAEPANTTSPRPSIYDFTTSNRLRIGPCLDMEPLDYSMKSTPTMDPSISLKLESVSDSGVVFQHESVTSNNRRKISTDLTEDDLLSSPTRSLDSGFKDSTDIHIPATLESSYRLLRQHQLPPKKRRLHIEQDLSVSLPHTQTISVPTNQQRCASNEARCQTMPNLPYAIPTTIEQPKGFDVTDSQQTLYTTQNDIFQHLDLSNATNDYGYSLISNISTSDTCDKARPLMTTGQKGLTNIQDLSNRFRDAKITMSQTAHNAQSPTESTRLHGLSSNFQNLDICMHGQNSLDNRQPYVDRPFLDTTIHRNDNSIQQYSALLSIQSSANNTIDSGLASMDNERTSVEIPNQTVESQHPIENPSATKICVIIANSDRNNASNNKTKGMHEESVIIKDEGGEAPASSNQKDNTTPAPLNDKDTDNQEKETSGLCGLLADDHKIVLSPDDDGDLPLHIAVVQSQPNVIERLLFIMRKANVTLDYPNYLKQTPLHLAVITKQADIITQLLKAGASAGVQDRKGNTSFHLAVNHRTPMCLDALLQHSNVLADLNAKNFEGLTPLHRAVQTGSEQCMALLVKHGADIDMVDGKSGKSPLYMAFECNRPHIADLLLSRGADVNVPTYSGSTVLQAANTKGQHLLNHLMSKERPLETGQIRGIPKSKKNHNTILTHSRRRSTKLSTNQAKPPARDTGVQMSSIARDTGE